MSLNKLLSLLELLFLPQWAAGLACMSPGNSCPLVLSSGTTLCQKLDSWSISHASLRSPLGLRGDVPLSLSRPCGTFPKQIVLVTEPQ